MYCEYCGNKIEEIHKFCTKCGKPISFNVSAEHFPNQKFEEKWWLRLAKVVYVLLYIPLPFLIILVWGENSSTYNYYTRTSTDTTGEAFWYSLLVFLVYVIIARLIKITFLYIVFSQKPHWKKEFKKPF
jgi:NhaP-type Na+/H+ or K+/H+ antiporter